MPKFCLFSEHKSSITPSNYGITILRPESPPLETETTDEFQRLLFAQITAKCPPCSYNFGGNHNDEYESIRVNLKIYLMNLLSHSFLQPMGLIIRGPYLGHDCSYYLRPHNEEIYRRVDEIEKLDFDDERRESEWKSIKPEYNLSIQDSARILDEQVLKEWNNFEYFKQFLLSYNIMECKH